MNLSLEKTEEEIADEKAAAEKAAEEAAAEAAGTTDDDGMVTMNFKTE